MSRYPIVIVVLTLGLAALAMGAGPAAASKSTPTPAPSPTATPTPNLAYPYTMTDLGSLGYGVTYGLAINNNGQITGYGYTSKEFQVTCPPHQYGGSIKCFERPYHAFLWSNGTMTDIGAAFYPVELYPTSINDYGVIVGGSSIWRNGTLQNLNNLVPPGSGFTLDDATGINDKGQIVVNGSNGAGEEAFLLTPTK